MIIVYLLVAVLIAAAVAFVVIRSRGLKKSDNGQSDHGESDAGSFDPSTVLRLDARVERAPRPPSAERFDPGATQVYGRLSKDKLPAAPRKREGTSAPVASGARLIGLSGSCKGKVFPIAATGITVGRNSACNIVLTDARISGRHAWIGIVDGKVILRDSNSTNGTFLNAQTQTAITEVELRPNDTIFFGGHQGDQFRFVLN